jgi:hypothetical protein
VDKEEVEKMRDMLNRANESLWERSGINRIKAQVELNIKLNYLKYLEKIASLQATKKNSK